MIRATTINGRQAFVCRIEDIHAAAEWARCLCHLVLGPIKGEAHYRALPAAAVLSLWAEPVSVD